MDRDFLNNITIAGAILVSQTGDLLHYTIPNLLKWCDWIMIMLDNENRKSREIVFEYQKKYSDRIKVEYSYEPRTEKAQMFRRFKILQGTLRDRVLQYFKDKNIDILIFPDSDEFFTDSLKDLLIDFWKSDKKVIFMRPVNLFGDTKTIAKVGMPHHHRIVKYFPELTALPYRGRCFYRPLEKKDIYENSNILVHAHRLTVENREWRKEYWKGDSTMDTELWQLDKDIREFSPKEIIKIFEKKPDLTVGEYLKIK